MFSTLAKVIGVVLVVLLGAAIPAEASVTVTLNSGTIVVAGPSKYGINISPYTNYDNGQLYKNILCNGFDCGFEPFLDTQIYQIQSGGTNSSTQCQTNINNTQYDGVTANWWNGGTAYFYTLGAAPGSDLIGSATITANTVAGTSPNGPTYTYSGGVAGGCVPGNMMIVSKNTAPSTAAQLQLNCTGTGACTPEITDLCASCGTEALALDGTSGAVTLPIYMDASSQNKYVLVNGGTWTLSFSAKLSTGSGNLTAAISRVTGCTFSPFTTTGTWSQYSATCNPTDSPTGSPSTMTMTFAVPSGTKILLDNVSFERTSGGDSTNTSIYSDAVKATLIAWYQNSVGGTEGTCRYGPEPAGTTLADWTQTSQFNHLFTNPGINYAGALQMTGLFDFLNMAKLVGCEPELIFPITFTYQDAEGLIDYLAGGSGTAYGAIRIAQGQTTPWSSVFPNIFLSFGNENWNGQFVGQAIGYRLGSSTFYTDYVNRAHTIFTAMHSQPSYVSNIQLVIGTQTGVAANSADVATSTADRLEIQGYTQANVSDDSTPSLLWLPAMTQPWSMNNDTNDSLGFEQNIATYQGYTSCGPSGAAQCIAMIYEQNNSTDAGTITQAYLDEFVDAEGYAIVTAQEYLQNMKKGISPQNLYALTGYFNTLNGKNVHIWGAVVDMGGSTSVLNSSLFGGSYTPRPQMLGAMLANECNIGSLFLGTIASPDTYNLPTNNNGVNAISNVPYEFVYPFIGSGNNRCVDLINTDPVNSHTVTFAGPDAPTTGTTVTQVQLSGSISGTNEAANTSPTNTTAASVYLVTSTLTNFQPTVAFTLPSNSETILVYTLGSSPTNIQSQGVTYQGVKIQ